MSMADPTFYVAPFQAKGLKHRERMLSPDELKKLRPNLYALTNVDEFNDPEVVPHCKAVLRDLDGLTDQEISQSVFYVFFRHDEECVTPLRRIIRCGGLFVPPKLAAKAPYWQTTGGISVSLRETSAIIGELHAGNAVHENICQAIEMTRHLEGDYVEIGVFTGSSACTALRFMHHRGIDRKCWFLDTYEGFAYDSAGSSADIMWHGTHLTSIPVAEHMQNLDIKLSMAGSNYRMVKNNIHDDPFPEEIKKIAVANLDVDMYEAILVGLHKIAPLIVLHGIIICEDATSTPALYGAYVAMEDFLLSDMGKKFIKIFVHGQYFLIKVLE